MKWYKVVLHVIAMLRENVNAIAETVAPEKVKRIHSWKIQELKKG